jgi:transcriptional regulator with XRE-family HTH domain
MLSFGEKLRIRLRAAGKTPSDLAQLTGSTPQQVNKWLQAENPELFTLYRIAKGLDLPVESLIEGIDPDYDAMRRLEGYARAAELLARVPDPQREWLWRLLLTLAGAPETESQ